MTQVRRWWFYQILSSVKLRRINRHLKAPYCATFTWPMGSTFHKLCTKTQSVKKKKKKKSTLCDITGLLVFFVLFFEVVVIDPIRVLHWSLAWKVNIWNWCWYGAFKYQGLQFNCGACTAGQEVSGGVVEAPWQPPVSESQKPFPQNTLQLLL